MEPNKIVPFIKGVLKNLPSDWLNLTTHRLDIYNEELAKSEFLEQFEKLHKDNTSNTKALLDLPTAYDYIRLGHPLSSVLEWTLAHLNGLKAENVISFSSKTMPILAVLRKNALEGKNTQILYTGVLPECFEAAIFRQVYRYHFELKQVDDASDIAPFEGSTIFISEQEQVGAIALNPKIDFFIGLYKALGSIIAINGKQNQSYIGAIQHVRRRESIAMTPANALSGLEDVALTPRTLHTNTDAELSKNKKRVLEAIEKITGSHVKAVVGSSGLSIQYAILMGLIHDALENHKGKAIKIVVPPNCYGGTNDQARRVAASLDTVEVVDLPVDGDNDMVQSVDRVLDILADQDAIPYIIAEIPTNPRVEVPDMVQLEAALTKARKTPSGEPAIAPVFILDQTFCPNTNFLGQDDILTTVSTIAYVSGSKFPSGGKCTAGYSTANEKGARFMEKIGLHLNLCDNEATALQYQILARQLPSMNQRIEDAYQNTRAFVDFIKETLPEAKINFVSRELAAAGFTPSVFSLDLPTKGNTAEEKEAYKSKDYIARVALSPDLDLELHKKVFQDFVATM